MTNLIKIHNVETGKIIEREMNAEELEQLEKNATAKAKELNEQEIAAKAKAALLAKIGITADEAKLLLS